MTCPKCNANNIEGSSFCVKCGTNLKGEGITPKVVEENKTPDFNYMRYISKILLKPITTFNNNEEQLNETKVSLTLAAIVSGLMVLVIVFQNVIANIVKTKFDYSTLKLKKVLDFDGLSNIEWLNVIFKNFFVFLGIIGLITIVYYLAGIKTKKTNKVVKILSITSTSLIPYVIISVFANELVKMIWLPLSFITTVSGIVYSILIFINLINEEFKYEIAELRVYLHSICLSIIGSTLWYLYIKFMVSSAGSKINDLLNILK